MNSQTDLRTFLTLAGTGATAALAASVLPTPTTPDAHGYINYLQATGKDVLPEGKWKPTHPDILGPFWAGGAPFRGKVTPPMAPGKLLVVSGTVWSHTTKRPIPNAVLDVWQADHKGVYDFQTAKTRAQRPVIPEARGFTGRTQPTPSEFANRIRLLTDENGRYEYETIKPAAYNVGTEVRPSHIHYMAQARGHARLITQCYFKGDKHIATDPWASKSPLTIPLTNTKCQHGQYLTGRFDLILGPAAS